jgi:hypothetical protein
MTRKARGNTAGDPTSRMEEECWMICVAKRYW